MQDKEWVEAQHEQRHQGYIESENRKIRTAIEKTTGPSGTIHLHRRLDDFVLAHWKQLNLKLQWNRHLVDSDAAAHGSDGSTEEYEFVFIKQYRGV